MGRKPPSVDNSVDNSAAIAAAVAESNLPALIRLCRERVGYTQEQLTDQIKVNAMALWHWEHGKNIERIPRPHIDNMVRVLNAHEIFNVWVKPIDEELKEAELKNDVFSYIKLQIEKQGFTLGNIAERIGYSPSAVSKALSSRQISQEMAGRLETELKLDEGILKKMLENLRKPEVEEANSKAKVAYDSGDVCDYVRAQLVIKNMSMQELSKAMGFAGDTVSKWFSRNNIPQKHFSAIETSLKLDEGTLQNIKINRLATEQQAAGRGFV